MELLTYKCFECDKKRPCVLSNLTDDDDFPSKCPLDACMPKWVLEVEESEPYDAKEAYADHKLESDKDAKLLDKLS